MHLRRGGRRGGLQLRTSRLRSVNCHAQDYVAIMYQQTLIKPTLVLCPLLCDALLAGVHSCSVIRSDTADVIICVRSQSKSWLFRGCHCASTLAPVLDLQASGVGLAGQEHHSIVFELSLNMPAASYAQPQTRSHHNCLYTQSMTGSHLDRPNGSHSSTSLCPLLMCLLR